MEDKKPVGRPKKEEVDVKMFGEWRGNMEYIIKEKKKEVDTLQNTLLMTNMNLRQIQEAIAREKADWDREKAKLKSDFNRDMDRVRNDIEKKRYATDNGLIEHTKRMQELEAREKRVMDLEEEKKKLSLARIEVEKLTQTANEMVKNGRTQLEVSDDKLSKAATIEVNNLKEKQRLNSLESAINQREEKNNEVLSKIEKEKSNLEIIREEITPRITELKKQEETNRELLDKVSQEKKDLQEKIAEERHLLEKLDAEKSNMEVAKKIMAQKEEALKRDYLVGVK